MMGNGLILDVHRIECRCCGTGCECAYEGRGANVFRGLQIENLFTATVINKFMRRHEDWLKQADSDLCAAEDSASSNHYEWACFQAQQAAEKALKALLFQRAVNPVSIP